MLEDFNSQKMRVSQVPLTASSTCIGQKLIKPPILPIPYQIRNRVVSKLSEETIKEYGLAKLERPTPAGSATRSIHKYDHIKQNIKLAPKINYQKCLI